MIIKISYFSNYFQKYTRRLVAMLKKEFVACFTLVYVKSKKKCTYERKAGGSLITIKLRMCCNEFH